VRDPLGHRHIEGNAATSRLLSPAVVVVVPDDALPHTGGPARSPVASLALAGAALNDPSWPLLTCGAVATAALGPIRLRMATGQATRLRWSRASVD